MAEKPFIIRDLEQLKILADPLRVRIMEALRDQPKTTKQVATLLGENPTRLYHHVDLLEQAGVIQLTRTRRKRGTMEKYYQLAAEEISIAPNLFSVQSQVDEAVQALLEAYTALLQATLADIRRTLESRQTETRNKKHSVLINRSTIRASKRTIDRLRKKLTELLGEWEAADRKDGKFAYRLTTICYPIVDYETTNQE